MTGINCYLETRTYPYEVITLEDCRAIPRRGEAVYLGRGCYKVSEVIWYVRTEDNKQVDVRIILEKIHD